LVRHVSIQFDSDKRPPVGLVRGQKGRKTMAILTTAAEANEYNGRRRVRIFRGASVSDIVADRIKAARDSATGRACSIQHAGGVPNCYDYPATTQALLVAAWADGRAIVITGTIPANKVTCAGAAAATGGEAARAVWDGRYGAAARKAARVAMWQRLEDLATPGNLWVG
jgi:hypothetical protein